jgi:hypothetical protein
MLSEPGRVSRRLRIELAEAVFATALRERWGRHWRQYRADGRSRRRARRLLTETTVRHERFSRQSLRSRFPSRGSLTVRPS